MPNPGFDITSLAQFKPPEYMCEKCLALLLRQPVDWNKQQGKCPVCHVLYAATDEYPYWNVGEYLKSKSLAIEFGDLIGHSRTLAAIAISARNALLSPNKARPSPNLPIQALFESLLSARKFVHFTTYGISPVLIGAIKMTAQRVPVRGIVSNVDNIAKEELTKYKDEAPKLEVRLFERSDQRADWDATPHQKTIVIDGLLAFKGSANLTTPGWRKAAQGLDVIEVVTDVNEVVELHNRYFSPIWASFSTAGEQITLSNMTPDDIPF